MAVVESAADADDALRLANDSEFGLTSGLHSLDEREIAMWRDRIQAGNLYINRGTTGAIVQRQPFGGWKGSGTTGKGIASAYYLALYQREQSQTWVE